MQKKNIYSIMQLLTLVFGLIVAQVVHSSLILPFPPKSFPSQNGINYWKPKAGDVPQAEIIFGLGETDVESEFTAIFDYDTGTAIYKDTVAQVCYLDQPGNTKLGTPILEELASFCGTFPLRPLRQRKILRRVHRNRRSSGNGGNGKVELPLIGRSYIMPETGQEMILLTKEQYFDMLKSQNPSLNGFRMNLNMSSSLSTPSGEVKGQKSDSRTSNPLHQPNNGHGTQSVNVDTLPPKIPGTILSSGSLEWDSSDTWARIHGDRKPIPMDTSSQQPPNQHDMNRYQQMPNSYTTKPTTTATSPTARYQQYSREQSHRWTNQPIRRNYAYVEKPRFQRVVQAQQMWQHKDNGNWNTKNGYVADVQADDSSVTQFAQSASTPFPMTAVEHMMDGGERQREELERVPDDLQLPGTRIYSDHALQGKGQEFRLPPTPIESDDGRTTPYYPQYYPHQGASIEQQQAVYQPGLPRPTISSNDDTFTVQTTILSSTTSAPPLSAGTNGKPKCCTMTFTCKIVLDGNQWKRFCHPKQQSQSPAPSQESNGSARTARGGRQGCCCCTC